MTLRSNIEEQRQSDRISLVGQDSPLPPTERLPFRIRLATTDELMRHVTDIRHKAYARHLPDFAETLKVPESDDFAPNTFVLLAESKLDGSPLGTMRIQTNAYEPLSMEHSITLPDWLQGQALLEATRLSVSEGGVGRVVKAALLKACFTFAKRAKIDWMVITARKPLDRQYEALMFLDVFSEGELFPMSHVGGIPHRVMAINVPTAESRWADAQHPLYQFMCCTVHPDIALVHEEMFNTPPKVLSNPVNIANPQCLLA